MKNVYTSVTFLFLLVSTTLCAQQLPNNQFEDWSGPEFKNAIQPASWHYSNVEQLGVKFNFSHRETGRNGGYCIMVQDQDLEVAGIGETSPGYIALGQPWVYIESLGKVSEATAGTYGGLAWTARPDTMAVWIKRTGSAAMNEDFHLLYYAWKGTAHGDKYKGKNGKCTEVSWDDEESDIRQGTNGNECGTTTSVNQIAEGWVYGRKVYNDWTLIKVPIYYNDNNIPEKVNVIFSAGNYPNFRANDGLNAGNSLFVDDVTLIYSSKIQKLYIDGTEWRNFNPNSTEPQTYIIPEGTEDIPSIKAFRGIGQLTNNRGVTTLFQGRQLQGSEISIVPGEIGETPTRIIVKAEDGQSETTYQIFFTHKASSNAALKSILVDNKEIKNYNPYITEYTAEVEYGKTSAPVVTVVKQEDKQTIRFTQPTSINDVTSIVVTAADGTTTKTYTIRYKQAQLSDNTLAGIKVNGYPISNFDPQTTRYTIKLPLGTTQMPSIVPISKYADGMQTITMTAPSQVEGGVYQIAVTSPGNSTPTIYKLTFKLEPSNNCCLQNIYINGEPIANFTPENTSYTVTLPIGTLTLPTITWLEGDGYQTISMAEGGIDGITRITVKAANEDVQVYKIGFTTLKSSVNTLAGILINGTAIEDFDPQTTTYTIQLPIGTTQVPTIAVVEGDPYETISIRNNGLLDATVISVKAGDGSTKIYQIYFIVEQATNSTLKSITVDGVELPGFDANTLEYSYILPHGTTILPLIGFTQHDEYQTITTRSGGVNGDYKITVRPQSGSSRTYVIHFSVPKSDDAYLQMIWLNGQPLQEFQKETLNYIDTIDNNDLPNITYQGNNGQKIISYFDDNLYTIKVTAESGRSNIYTIQFLVRVSENAFLKMIYLNDDSLDVFAPDKMIYKNIYLSGKTAPSIRVDSELGQQVTILSPAGAGIARIFVTSSTGSQNIYQLELVDTTIVPIPHLDPEVIYTPSSNASLQAILLDGIALSNFDPTQEEYTIQLQAGEDMPTIMFVPGNSSQTLISGQTAEHIYQAQVIAEDGIHSTVYRVIFQRTLYANAYLQDLQVEGKNLEFVPETLTYQLPLDEGQSLPQLTYQSYPGQTIMMYAVDDTTQQLIVTAEDGTSNTYIITYTRVISHNALLKDILIDGLSLPGFDSYTYHYIDTLAFRTPVVPSINAIGAVEGQTITTYFSAVKGTTRIHVLAEDGVTSSDYFITFPTEPSTNTELKNLWVSDGDLNFDADVTEYKVLISQSATIAPTITYEKAQKEQLVTYIARPIGDTSLVIVHAENGAERIYSVLFERQAEAPANVLQTIFVQVNNELFTTFDLTQTTQHEFEIALPYGATSMTVAATTNNEQQTVLIEPGGLYHPTNLVVLSNNGEQANTTYTIIPTVNTQEPAVLTSIMVDNQPVTDFQSTRYSYIVDRLYSMNVPEVAVTLNAQDSVVSKQTTYYGSTIIVTSKDTSLHSTHTYQLHFHYPNDVIPNGEFTQWDKTAVSNTDKPASWNVPGDYVSEDDPKWLGVILNTSKPEETVKKESSSIVHLSTTYYACLASAMPSVMNLATMSAKLEVAGNSKVSTSGTIAFHNTPDYAVVNYHYPDEAGDNALFHFKFKDESNTTHSFKFVAGKTASYQTYEQPLATDGYSIQGMDIIINATNQTSNASGKANLYVDYIRFGYKNTLDGIVVNGIEATPSDNNNFSVTLKQTTDVSTPTLSFIQSVSDQAQKVEWTEPVVDGAYSVRTAMITNYGEDGNYSAYTLTVNRPMDTNAALRSILINNSPIAGFKSSTTTYTYHLDPDTKTLPDVTPVLSSNLASCTTTRKGSTIIIRVTPEYGQARTYTVNFIVDDERATLKNIVAENMTPAFSEQQFEYTILGNELPSIAITKLFDTQQVSMTEGVIDVIAPNGAHQQYTISLNKPSKTTTGQLKEMELDGDPLSSFDKDKYQYELPRPNWTAFTRQDLTDSVVYIQTPDSLVWQVYGSEQHHYILTPRLNINTSTELKGIYVNNSLLDGFDAQIHQYTLHTDSALHLRADGISPYQNISITRDNNTYQITVIAQNGNIGTYTVDIKPATSSDASLLAIYLNGNSIESYDPQQLVYTITLPTGEYKQMEPIMPTISYIPADRKAEIEVETGGLNDTTKLYVTSSDGTIRNVYELIILAEPSHNAQLTALAVNDIPFAEFEPDRHYYSTLVSSLDVTFDWRSNDHYQTIELDTVSAQHYILHVTAQDKITTADYHIELMTKELSNDATLKDILIDGQSMNTYRTDLNTNLQFNSGMNKYTINIPNKFDNLPQVAATLKTDEQQVTMRQEDMTIYIDVTAENGSLNTYTIQFIGTLSHNTSLKSIYLDGEAYNAFHADQFFYFIDLPAGQHKLPDLFPQKAESAQKWDTTSVSLSIGQQVNITVTAEDPMYQAQYVLLFQKHPSSVDTLKMIIADSLEFQYGVYNYTCSWPYASDPMPALEWEAGDVYQTIYVDTLEQTELSLVRQIVVCAENGQRNRYTITYTMQPNNETTLKMIYLNGADSLSGFDPLTTNYICTLPIGTTQAPVVEAVKGHSTQTITDSTYISTLPSGLTTTQFEVTAQNGDKRSYTVTFIVALDTIATLNQISYNNKPVSKYDEQRYAYSISLDKDETQLPLITFIKHDENQVVDIVRIDSNNVQLNITAADGQHKATYLLTFMPYLSNNGQLQAILLNDTLMPNFNATKDHYEVRVDSLSSLPEISCVKAEPTQTVIICTTNYYNTDSLIYDVLKTIKVVPENQIDTFYYDILFHIKSNTPLKPEESENANLLTILIRGQQLSHNMGFDQDFNSNVTNYYLNYPIGTNPDIFFTDSDIVALVQDSLAEIVSYDFEVTHTAQDTAGIEVKVGTCIHITVMAPAGNLATYNIYQNLILDSLNQVTDLIVADYQGVMRSLTDFEQTTYYYEYILSDSRTTVPEYTLTYANTASRFACISIERANNSRIVEADDDTNYATDNSEDDPTYHICYKAENGTKYVYKIKFIRTDIKRAQKPMEGDVLIQHIPGTNQIAVASLRANVVFALYDMAGHMINLVKLEEGNPNSFEITTDGFGQTYFGHLTDYSSCTILTLETSKIYFWAFTENGKRKIKSGKIVILP